MHMKLISASFLATAFLVTPHFAAAATVTEANLGRILLDTSGHGEAWYVNPQSYQRVYLGRPADAFERLLERAIPVNYFHVERLATVAGGAHDAEYAKKVAGQVLLPNDLVGAAWYVDPVSGLRKRLASPADAWDIMKAGTRVNATTLAAIPREGVVPKRPALESIHVKSVLTADTLELEDGAKLRILNVETPANPDLQETAMLRLRQAIGTSGLVTIERDVDDRDRDSRLLRHVFVGELNLGYELVRRGLAFHNIEEPNFKYAEQLIVASLDAARLKNGFWTPR